MNDAVIQALIDKVLHNPLLLIKLSDRVYERMQEERWHQVDRNHQEHW